MANFWKRACRRAFMHDPTDRELQHYLDCYRAGYERGVRDVSNAEPLEEWSPLTWEIAIKLATDRSAIEGGCWLAGMRTGRKARIGGVNDIAGHMIESFAEQWEADYIADCALECSPAGMKFRRLLSAMVYKRKTQPIKDRLGRALTN